MFKLISYCAGAVVVYLNDSTLHNKGVDSSLSNRLLVTSMESFVFNVRTYAKSNTASPFPTQFIQTLAGLYRTRYSNWGNELESLNALYKQMVGTDVVKQETENILSSASFNSDSTLQADGLNVSYLNSDPTTWK